MDATTPPSDPEARRARLAPPKTSKRAVVLWVVGGLVLLGGAVTAALLSLSDTQVHHARPLVIPVSAPVGEPLKVDYAVKPGDVFVSTVISKSSFILATDDKFDTGGGMAFDVKLTVGHGIEKGVGAHTASKMVLYVERSDATLGPMAEAVWLVLGKRERPYALDFQRDAAGRPDRSTLPSADPTIRTRRHMVDLVLAGLGDLTTNFLPARDVRRGEVWDLEDVGDLKDGIENVIREIAQRKPGREGFPTATIVGKVQAQGEESKPPVELTYSDPPKSAAPPAAGAPPAGAPPAAAPAPAGPGEPCLRLGLFVTVNMQGETNEPRLGPGWISTAARISGPIWVSRSTGILWAVDLTGEVVSTYRTGKRPTEIKATMRIKSTTERAKRMPV